jgi:hypothetical protein
MRKVVVTTIFMNYFTKVVKNFREEGMIYMLNNIKYVLQHIFNG